MRFSMNSQTFRRMVQIPLMIAKTATIQADEDGFKIVVVDARFIMMAVLNVPRQAMTVYDEPETFSVDLKKLAATARLAEKDEDITAIVKDGRIILTFGTITRTTALLDRQAATPRILSIKYPVQFTLSSEILADAIRSVSDVGEIMTVDLREDGTIIMSSRQDVDEAEYSVQTASHIGACRSGYLMSYVQMILRIVPQGRLIADLGKDMPLRISFDGTLSGSVILQPTVRREDE